MTLRAIARSRARTRALGSIALNRRKSNKTRVRSIDREELWVELSGADDDFVAIDCRPRALY